MNRSPQPGRDLLAQVRAAFILRGTTLTAWSKENGVQQTHLRQALLGSWDGPIGREWRERALAAAGPLPEIGRTHQPKPRKKAA